MTEKKKEKSFKTCEIMQQLEYIDMDIVNAGLKDNSIKDYAYIVHDKDTYEAEDGSVKPKAPHIHLMLRLNDSRKVSTIANLFGVQSQYVGSIKGKFADAIKYLTHMNAPHKFQYHDDDVVSNFDFKNERVMGSFDFRKSEIINGIADGTIREFNYFDYITAEENSKYKRDIENTFKYRSDKLRNQEVNKKMEVIYIQGASGAGKSTMAKEFAKTAGFSVFVSSGSNDIMDGYAGQDCIILDDLRASCMALTDLLKMLDNNTQSTIKSRYRNKVLECKMIIITTVQSLEAFYKNVFQDENEPIVQFKRRCKTLVRMNKETIQTYAYLDDLDEYILITDVKNDVLAKYQKSAEEMARDRVELLIQVNKSLEANKDKLIQEMTAKIEKARNDKHAKDVSFEPPF